MTVTQVEEIVLKQIRSNARFWGSDMCKRKTVEKYCQQDGLVNVKSVMDDLIKRGIVVEPRKGYVAVKK